MQFSGIPPDHNPRSAESLVPRGPRSALVCRYYGLPKEGDSRKAGTLMAHAAVRTKAQLDELVRAFSGLRKLSGGALSCPEDRGAGAYVLFQYRDEPSVPVRVNFGGCETVGNGRRGMVFEATPQLVHVLTAIVPADASSG